ncbi:hypothetical protein RRG08_005565 [Elysia crispata]|uniref:Uncharacterized protein n=1 Tax=Elysia crispata TaxID=231223 RepID=A0AAE1E058_9GAST|nr:hypothetical protein RRG08_005565 [Elysia crispata]
MSTNLKVNVRDGAAQQRLVHGSDNKNGHHFSGTCTSNPKLRIYPVKSTSTKKERMTKESKKLTVKKITTVTTARYLGLKVISRQHKTITSTDKSCDIVVLQKNVLETPSIGKGHCASVGGTVSSCGDLFDLTKFYAIHLGVNVEGCNEHEKSSPTTQLQAKKIEHERTMKIGSKDLRHDSKDKSAFCKVKKQDKHECNEESTYPKDIPTLHAVVLKYDNNEDTKCHQRSLGREAQTKNDIYDEQILPSQDEVILPKSTFSSVSQNNVRHQELLTRDTSPTIHNSAPQDTCVSFCEYDSTPNSNMATQTRSRLSSNLTLKADVCNDLYDKSCSKSDMCTKPDTEKYESNKSKARQSNHLPSKSEVGYQTPPNESLTLEFYTHKNKTKSNENSKTFVENRDNVKARNCKEVTMTLLSQQAMQEAASCTMPDRERLTHHDETLSTISKQVNDGFGGFSSGSSPTLGSCRGLSGLDYRSIWPIRKLLRENEKAKAKTVFCYKDYLDL